MKNKAKEIIENFKRNYKDEDIKNLQIACTKVEKLDKELVEMDFYVICVEEVKKDLNNALWSENKAFNTLKKQMSDLAVESYGDKENFKEISKITQKFGKLYKEFEEELSMGEFDYYNIMDIIKRITEIV